MILNDLVSQVGLEIFFDEYLYKKPFAAQKTAKAFENLISWPMLEQIFSAQHRECWLPKNGLLPEDPWLNRGLLTACQAKKEFALGRTVLVRHSEKVAPCLASIASDFYKLFDRTVDIQIYVTPAGEEGFDWHYDNEDVFVVQSQGEKEFRLLPNTVCRKPLPMFNPHNKDFEKEKKTGEIRCWLKPGDMLYIPAGYWHKARAITNSFHLSVGVAPRY